MEFERNPSQKILMGPGPSTVDPRILRAMSQPTLGHLDPDFLQIMNDTMDLLRYVFNTKNQLTMAMSGTGSSGMETTFVNLLEPGDKALICINGVFGQRMADVAGRCGAEVITVDFPWGEPVQADAVEKTLKNNPGVKILAVVHAETSTGVLQPLTDLSRLAQEYNCLFLADTVTSLGGMPVDLDDNGVDVSYSGTQKCLGCPPGLSPVSFNQAAVDVINNRKTKVQSWYLDLTMIQKYWGKERLYHHTAPVNMIYALHEALRIIKEEGRENRYRRHWHNCQALINGLEAMGLKMLVAEKYRLPSLTTVRVPEGVDEAEVRRRLLEEYRLEIGGGLGPLKGQVWRVGLMGYASTKTNVMLFLTALGDILNSMGITVDQQGAVQAAARV